MRIEDFRDIHKGKRAFIIGNGPSLNKVDLNLLKDELTFGGNNIFKHKSFTPKYYAIEDWGAIENNYKSINEWNGPEYKFVARRFGSDFIRGNNVIPIRFRRWRMGSNDIRRTCDKNNSIFFWMGTVTNLSIQLAYYMGCNPIYLIGVDHFLEDTTKPIKHFSDDYVTNGLCNPSNVKIMTSGYQVNKDSLEKNGYKVYNLTPDSYLDVFDKLKFEDII